jgi:hypothetical protein
MRGARVLRCSTDSGSVYSAASGSQLFSDVVHIVDCPGGHGDRQVKPVVLTGLHPLAVESKEHLAGGPRQPLVAIDESVVAAQGMQKCCGLGVDIGYASDPTTVVLGRATADSSSLHSLTTTSPLTARAALQQQVLEIEIDGQVSASSPEHFAVARGADPSKHKQFRRGIEQLEQEGVVQVLRSDRRGDQAPVLAAVARCGSRWPSTGWPSSSAPRSRWSHCLTSRADRGLRGRRIHGQAGVSGSPDPH